MDIKIRLYSAKKVNSRLELFRVQKALPKGLHPTVFHIDDLMTTFFHFTNVKPEF